MVMSMQSTEQMGIFFRYYDLPAGFPVIALLGSGWHSTLDPVTRLHFHNCVELGFLCEGSCKLILEEETFVVRSPAVTILPPNKPHYTQACPNDTNRWNWIYVDPVRLLTSLNPVQMNKLHQFLSHAHGHDCVINNEDAPEIIQLVKMIVHEMENKEAYYKTIVRGLFASLFPMLFRNTPDTDDSVVREQPRQSGRISPAITYIEENYMNVISVDELAALCHVSVTHLRRLFHQSLGWSPQEYVHVVRIGHACDLLFNEDCSVTEVAARVGYSAASSLTRQFSHMYGISPNQWRQKARREENPEVVSYLNAIPMGAESAGI